ncbi:hypothetical protein CDES_00850 [Corynebacterium deserti GIMN1.010]|uniref:DUF885 domain-containing protein n=1 Tax=Corynebacterium deserti GIMN1.010 TaxID=931089 RepID=A0A0M4CUR9_9CORY|nr:DUF885 family protein [Corynebacterium deserti]ALC04650.1 hypothetical protein CDES_00850 [Corynebacterium deserti GIMN1.010]
MTLQSSDIRTPSLLDASCEVFVHDLAALSPTDATAWGISGFEGELQDFSPDYWNAIAERKRDMVADVDAFDDGTDDNDDEEDFDHVDRVTADVLRDRLCLDLALHHQGETLRLLNNIDSPVQTIRDTFLIMPRATEDDIDNIRERLSRVPDAVHGYCESLAEAASQGRVAAIRQIEDVVSQCEDLADEDSILKHLGLDEGDPVVVEAQQAFARVAGWLSEQLAPHAPHDDAVGRDRYEQFSHLHVGEFVDLDEAYTWSLDQLREIDAEQQRLAVELYGPGTSIREAMKKLNMDERYLIRGTEALQEWMQGIADKAITDLQGKYFNIPEQARSVECLIDPAGTGGIFYTQPSDDFSRPGRMWWSVPKNQEIFHTWQELTTVFHEGVPGHHLQISQTLAEKNLNLWRRVACWNSGHGEGWALYAESLMQELGYHEDPGNLMGYYDAQRLRAARVAIDIGIHLNKKNPESTGAWDASYARSFLRENSSMTEAALSFELNRYLGWPGQAASYAIGQRLWKNLRHDALSQGQTMTDFHSKALSYGSIPMSILRDQILD